MKTPETFDDLVGQDAAIKTMMESPNHHFFFHSHTPGTGKTTAARLLANHLGANFIRYNASDSNSVEFIRGEFASRFRYGAGNQVILLDEADRLSGAAQGALRGILEETNRDSPPSIVVMTCNFAEKIIRPLKSRCVVIHFPPLEGRLMAEALLSQAEGFGSLEDYEAIARRSEGDMRKAVELAERYMASNGDRTIFTDPEFDSKGWLRRAMSERKVDDCWVEAMKYEGNFVDIIFDYAIASKASGDAKNAVTLASIQYHRDVLLGVREAVAMREYVRALAYGRV